MTVNTNFIMFRQNTKPKCILEVKNMVLDLSQDPTHINNIQRRILNILLSADRSQGVRVEQILEQKHTQLGSRTNIITAWNQLSKMLASKYSEDILTALPEMPSV